MKTSRGLGRFWGFAAALLGAASMPAMAAPKGEFHPQHLEKVISALSSALKEAKSPDAAGAAYGIVVNALNPFWTATAIGSQVAALELQVASTFQAPIKGADVEMQKTYIQSMVDGGYRGISVSPVDPDKLLAIAKAAREKGVGILAIDSDMPREARSIYVGTDNYKAGLLAGKTMVRALGKKGGKVVGMVGNILAPNATERIAGARDAFKGTSVEFANVLVDQVDLDRSDENARIALAKTPDMKGFMCFYGYNTPSVLKALHQAKKEKEIKVVSFDLAAETLAGLKAGIVTAALGQRPYNWGRLSVYILHAMHVLGEKRTLEILRPFLEGKNHDVLDTGIDVVTPEGVGRYVKYLDSIQLRQQ